MLADPGTAGQTYELAGPDVYTVRELVRFTLRLIGNGGCSCRCPSRWPKFWRGLFELLPSPPLTTSQVDLLKADNLASGALPGFHELGIQPKAVEEVVPTYIGRMTPAAGLRGPNRIRT